MSVSKKHLSQLRTRGRVCMFYRQGLTQEQIAGRLRLSMGTTNHIVNADIPKKDRKRLKSQNYARSKLGLKNPAYGKRPANYVGDCSDNKGYLTRVVNGKRQRTHRVIMAEMIGIPVEALPSHLHVHHIDGDPLNNSEDNLALVTSPGHRKIHSLQR